jgi:hypothetical protein
MVLFFAAFALAVLIPGVVGLPLALRVLPDGGPRAIGLGAACGLAVIMVVVRAAHMVLPIRDAAFGIGATLLAVAATAWISADVRRHAMSLLREHGKAMASMAVAMFIVVVAVNMPILFGNALQFDGTTNADSFTFTSSARYMLDHAFHGAADFSPEHPVYSISRSYFGNGATQPRPAAEGYLAWLSVVLGRDPMLLYNAVQAAGWALAAVSVMGFWPPCAQARPGMRMLVTLFTVACPALLVVALNSNFANIYHLPVATAYVLLSRQDSSPKTFAAGVLLLACLLGGYPELIPFMGLCRGLAVAARARRLRSWRIVTREGALLAMEAIAACCLVPWAALHAFTVFSTSMALSGGNDALRGNLYAGLPLFVAASAAWLWGNRYRSTEDAALNDAIAGMLGAFALMQCWMVYRGFDYGGFKLSEYFSPLFAGVLAASACRLAAQRHVAYERFLFVLAAGMVYQSSHRIVKSWRVADQRKLTADLQHAAAYADSLPRGTLIAMGSSPAFFYYGMWVNYLTKGRLVYDVSLKDTAGYLSPYVRLADQAPHAKAHIHLSIDHPESVREHLPCDIKSFGNVHIGGISPCRQPAAPPTLTPPHAQEPTGGGRRKHLGGPVRQEVWAIPRVDRSRLARRG